MRAITRYPTPSRRCAAAVTLSLMLLPLSLRADVTLTGVLQQGTVAGQNGQTAGSPVWNALGNEVSFANIYLTQPNAGYNAPFLNSGNGLAASVSYTLAPGTYDFYFFGMGFWDNDPGQYGLNLFFGGDNTAPGISAYSPKAVVSTTAVEAGRPTLSLNGDNGNQVPAPGSLTFISGGLAVTLTGYGFGEPGEFGGPALDRIGNLDSAPDLALDSVGRFTLTVTPVPEPTITMMSCLGAILTLVVFRFRHRTNPSG